MLLWLLTIRFLVGIIFVHIVLYESAFSRFRYSYFLIVAIVLILVVEKLVNKFRKLIINIALLSIGLILILSLLYVRHLCVIVDCVGSLLNLLAISANQGKMPVIDPNEFSNYGKKCSYPLGQVPWPSWLGTSLDFRHEFANSKTKLFCLSDYIVIRDYSIISIGDVLIFLSGFLSLIHILLLKYS